MINVNSKSVGLRSLRSLVPPYGQIAPLFVLAAITVVAATLRVIQARESLWIDELHTSWVAAGPLSEVAARAGMGNQSPLFFWLEWVLVRVFGASELTLRLPSIVAGSLLPVLLYVVATRWVRLPVVALAAAALVAIEPFFLFYGTEARPYALVQLLAVIHVGLLAELTRRPTLWLRIGFVVSAALLFHLHYTAALLFVADLLIFVIWRYTAKRPGGATIYSVPSFAIDVGLVALTSLPALPNVLGIYERRENWRSFVDIDPPNWMIFMVLPWAASALIIAGDVLAKAAIRVGRPLSARARRAQRWHILLLCWLLAPVIVAWLLTRYEVALLFFSRYLVAASPAAILLAASCAGLAPWRWTRWVIAAALVAASLVTSGMIARYQREGRFITDRQEDWRGAIAWLNEQRQVEPLPVIVSPGLIEDRPLNGPHDKQLEDYCLLPVSGLYRLDIDREDLHAVSSDSNRWPDDVLPRLGSAESAWLITRGRHSRATGVAVTSEKWDVEKERSFGNVHVVLLRRYVQ